jgi:DNA-directed RNA polymerase specialized sigma24 family protein
LEALELKEVIERCVVGDGPARAQFLAEYYELAKRAIAQIHRHHGADAFSIGDVEDICHELFVKLFADDCRALQRVHNPA